MSDLKKILNFMLLNLQKYFILLKVPGSFWLAELTSCNISARAEPSHFTLELLEPKLMNEPGRATEKPARAEPKRAGSWLDPPLVYYKSIVLYIVSTLF